MHFLAHTKKKEKACFGTEAKKKSKKKKLSVRLDNQSLIRGLHLYEFNHFIRDGIEPMQQKKKIIIFGQ